MIPAADTARRPMPHYRLENCGNSIYRLWRTSEDEPRHRPVAVVLSAYRTWTASPINVPGAAGWAFVCPTRRQAIAAITAWLDERNAA